MGNVPLTFKKNTLLMQLILIISMLSLFLPLSLSLSGTKLGETLPRVL